MLRKNRCRFSCILIMVLILAGTYTIYGNAESFAERAASLEMLRLYEAEGSGASAEQNVSIARFEKIHKNAAENAVWVSERVCLASRMVIGRLSERSGRIDRERCMPGVVRLLLLVIYFRVKCHYYIEAWLYVQKKQQCKVLINYIHDIDGKKRMSCLS